MGKMATLDFLEQHSSKSLSRKQGTGPSLGLKALGLHCPLTKLLRSWPTFPKKESGEFKRVKFGQERDCLFILKLEHVKFF